MKKIFFIFVGAMILIIAVGYYFQTKKAAQEAADGKPEIRIGVTLPLTGSVADIGQTNMKAIEMALANKSTHDLKYRYKLIFEDDQLSLKRAAINTAKFIHQDRVKAILSMWGVVSPAVADASEKNKIINFTCSGGLVYEKPYYVFNNYTQYDDIAPVLIQKLKKENIKSVVYVVSNVAAGIDQGDYMTKALKDAGINVLAYEKFNPDTIDFRMAVRKLELLKPDYWITFISPHTQIFTKQYLEITGKKNITTIDTFHEMPREFWGMIDGLWFVRSASGTKEFAEEFKKISGFNLQSCTGNIYDNLSILIGGFEKAPVKEGEVYPDNVDVVQAILDMKTGGGALGNYNIGENGIIRTAASISKIVNGRIMDEE